MDPNEALRRMLAKAAGILEAADRGDVPAEGDAIELAELVQDLDGWLRGGGFMPAAWRTAPPAWRSTGPLDPSGNPSVTLSGTSYTHPSDEIDACDSDPDRL